MRMGMRRFTRLTNGFSRKVENLAHAVSLHFMHYNFARLHQALKERYPRTPAMAAGVADHVWSLEEIAALLTREASDALERVSVVQRERLVERLNNKPSVGTEGLLRFRPRRLLETAEFDI